MTRINCVPVLELTRMHCFAEYRELPRIFRYVSLAVARGEMPGTMCPDHYVLGTGHCRFFYDKLGYLAERHLALCSELRQKWNYQLPELPTLSVAYSTIPKAWWNNWKPDDKAMIINRHRIQERLSGGKQ